MMGDGLNLSPAYRPFTKPMWAPNLVPFWLSTQMKSGISTANADSMQIVKEMEARFGFFPPFFEPALPFPLILKNLWVQTLTSYVDNPLPELFKEKLAAYVARECTIPYCLIVHSCSLRPLGMTAAQVLQLLTKDEPNLVDVQSCISDLKTYTADRSWPQSGNPLETLIFSSAVAIFSKRDTTDLQNELRRVVGDENFCHLTLFLSYNRTCHKWVEAHPEISYQADARAIQNLQPLLQEQPDLDNFFMSYQIKLRERILDRGAEQLSKEFRSLFEKSPMPIVITDLESNIVRVNEAFCELTGYDFSELVKSNIDKLDCEEDQGRRKQVLEPLIGGLEPAVSIDRALVQKSGRKVWVTETISAIKVAETPVYIIALLKDVTLERSERELEKYRAEQLEQRVAERTIELEAARDEAVRANRLKTEFVANISHEIRTPMSGILGLTEILAMEVDEEFKGTSELILKAAKTLMWVVDELLDVSKFETGKFFLVEKPFRLVEAIDDAVSTFQTSIKSKNLSLEVTTDRNVPEQIVGDQLRVSQILKNLISNAVKFTESGGIEISTKVLASGADRVTVEFSVKDSGIGIASQHHPHLFGMFMQADGSTTRRYGGTGLGLYLTKRLVGLMHGTIGVASGVGDGSVFTVTIPFCIATSTNTAV
ncbi:hypothetical protein BH10CYA1_BH10CYA1_57390 [soil metagenome]